MSRFLVFLVLVFLSALPVRADPFAGLLHNDLPSLRMDEMPLNGPYLGVVARQKARLALKHPSKHQLVVTGDELSAGPQNVNVGGLVITPGTRLPRSLREIIIMGNQTERITVLGNQRSGK